MVALEAIRQTGANLIGCQEFGIAILFVVVVVVECSATVVDCKRFAVVALVWEIREVAAAATLVEMSVEVTWQPHRHCHNLRPSVAEWAGRLI